MRTKSITVAAFICAFCGVGFFREPSRKPKFCSHRCKGLRQPAEERFWTKVQKADDPDGCWLWTGSCMKNGYGQIGIDARPFTTHRYSWTLAFGAIPKGLWVLHTCDVRACVRPSHLFLGTSRDNVRDMIAKGRNYRFPAGELATRAKMTQEQIRELRRRALDGEFLVDLAAEFGLSSSHVSRVVRGLKWRIK